MVRSATGVQSETYWPMGITCINSIYCCWTNQSCKVLLELSLF